ncbi:hypothetical protein BJ322DRAFT_179603 [Thelephora terrestris]|uniref:Uncharacterized protein n=1 Tax=Thelephora terrestris TaxID=56493 RepID=A0A9P6HA79_9AGAM|nr:hypothetical protein BJ322DRAFT_179603 [Thelephora terrestris]
MRLTLRSFLLFLRELVLLFRKRWHHMARRLWYILGGLRARFLSRNPERRNICPRVERRPAKSTSTRSTVICASLFPPTATPIAGGDTPTIVVRTATVDDTIQESHENNSAHNLDVNTHQNPEGSISGSSETIGSPNNSRPPSQNSYRPASILPERRLGRHPPDSQCSCRPPSKTAYHSPSNLDGAEAVARGYLEPSSSAQFAFPPSVNVNTSVSSCVYHASGRFAPSQPSPVTNASGPGVRLLPMIKIDRYEKHRKGKVGRANEAQVLPPATTEFEGEHVPEWTPLVHPEGALHWVNKHDPIYTDANMREPKLRQRIEEALEEMDNLMRVNFPPLPGDDWELVLELHKNICSYYFVRHSTRCLFWLHEFDPVRALGGLSGVTERTHIHLALQAHYWFHWEMYPHNREAPEHILQELRGILAHAGVDSMTSANSTTPYSEGDLDKFLSYVDHVTSAGGKHGFSACVVGKSNILHPVGIFSQYFSGRLMHFFLYARYLNFYGQKVARLASDQTIYGIHPKRTPLIKILSVLFFYTPELYLRGLESVYTDFLICQHRWARFITRQQDEWKDIIINVTVLLTANVAFLAIPGIGNSTQLASFFSTVTSIGSIVIGLLLVRKHRNKPEDSADNDQYLRSRHNPAIGFETLAILYSLPYSLLMWSTVSFTTAIGLETLVSTPQIRTKVSVGAVFAMVMLLIFWCVWITIEGRTDVGVFSAINRLVCPTVCPRGNTAQPPPDGDGEDVDGHQMSTMGGANSYATLVDQAGRNASCRLLGQTRANTGEVDPGRASMV